MSRHLISIEIYRDIAEEIAEAISNKEVEDVRDAAWTELMDAIDTAIGEDDA